MIKVRAYRQMFTDMLPSLTGISSLHYVRTEEELSKKIKELAEDELFLMVVIPSADSSSPDPDNISETDTCLLYCLKKVARRNQDDEDFIDDIETAQDAITLVKEKLHEHAFNTNSPFFNLMHGLDLSRMHTDPEYDYFGCDGYSLSYYLKTNWY